MDRQQLREAQSPLKEKYRSDPAAAVVTLRATGRLGEGVSCNVETGRALVQAGLHPATGGTGLAACSGDMLLQALVACAGVTLCAVATSMGLAVRGGTLTAEGDLDFRGTLGVSKEAPVGFRDIRLQISLDSDAAEPERRKLLELTERYCVVYQTLVGRPSVRLSYAEAAG
ncbi:MAG TPA: OsmC family protein [Gemmatimonadales bacterium]|nr:OsmC family protein [Gemmatimonadales bacterium]